jgi:hypothetical protein
MPMRFAQLSSPPARTLQIYLILIGCAANQQVITYGRLAERVGLLTPSWLFASLDRLAEWCFKGVCLPSLRWRSLRIRARPGRGIVCRCRISWRSRTEPANSIVRDSPADGSRTRVERSSGSRITERCAS